MRRRNSRNWIAAIVALVAVVAIAAVLLVQLVNYSAAWSKLPPGMTIGGVLVGGRDPQDARQQLLSTYGQAVTLNYQDHQIQLAPVDVGLQAGVDDALADAEEVRTRISFWAGFVDYLFDRPNEAAAVTLPITYSVPQLNTFLSGVAVRFDQPPLPPEAQPDSLAFTQGVPGIELDAPASLPLIDAALRSPTQRSATLIVRERAIPPPPASALQQLYAARLAHFSGTAGVFAINLQTGEELCLNCDVAYSGLSLLKVPIAIETFRRLSAEPDPSERRLLTETLAYAGHASANGLLALAGGGDPAAGAAQVTDDVRALGLQNTYIAAPFETAYRGGPVNTPANSRRDVDTHPDPARQTTPQDSALLLRMLYDCNLGGGALPAALPGDFGPEECDFVLRQLSDAYPGELLAGGAPPGTRTAQQMGWDGPTLVAAGVVYTPGGDFVLAVFLRGDPWLEWRDGEPVVRDLARATYNYYNITAQFSP
jgi:beta-lactamase class A